MKRKGKYLILLGLLLIAAALSLTGYNLYDDHRAGQTSLHAVAVLRERIPETTEPTTLVPMEAPPEEPKLPDYVLNPDMEMPVTTIDGIDYIGILEAPSLGLTLPVISEWDYANLKLAPCRYSGSLYQGNLVICGHNYSSHFGNLKNLNPGDKVLFLDMDGNLFSFQVAALETLSPTEVQEMESSDWNLTLFTCTVGAQNRVAIRCLSTPTNP